MNPEIKMNLWNYFFTKCVHSNDTLYYAFRYKLDGEDST